MIFIDSHSTTVIIVIHEIYGINDHIKNVCNQLSNQQFDIVCPNLLGKELVFDYSQEEMAYHYFNNNIGFQNGAKIIKNLIDDFTDRYEQIYVIGYSVGATIAWLCSEEKRIDGVIGYYGSRIRDYIKVVPKCPTLLFFPESEPSFDVDELILKLKSKNIRIHKLCGQHGFCDPFSKHYNEDSQKFSFKMMTYMISGKQV
ncbi:dienelactone hydrolase [Bacillus pakistanensis]|uniref:Dienelactone hydrolase n=1 Tax=Rossellomorea pakistanensis TaxID=992288 RepID=A0ABS2N748_9BACI|nr:dienelactone hydrolase family protein [Bacillus pakistanensis]MBM7583687.1 dienelactone hydrolase [Bacillus pakistanensis]